MATHIIIDGYNLIGSEKGLRGNLESKRRQLIQQLQQYYALKGHQITLVFDGWRSGWIHEVEEKNQGIRVIYSQQGEKADSVIQRLAREIGSGCVVVTSDRELQGAVEASGAVAVYAGEFSARLKGIDREIFLAPDEELEEESGGLRDREKRGNPRRPSKRERKRREKLRKL